MEKFLGRNSSMLHGLKEKELEETINLMILEDRANNMTEYRNWSSQ